MSLFRLVYASRSLLSDEPDWHASRSSRSYSYHAVTTRPPRSPERFSSAIPIFPEGPRADGERLYETLNHDPRHKDLLLLLSEPLAARQFPDWSMAYMMIAVLV